METYARLFDTYLPDPLSGPGRNKTADCPFCEAEGKFSVDVQKGKGQCLHAACGVKCNHISFLTKFHQSWLDFTTDEHYDALYKARGISPDTLRKAGLAYDDYADRWLIPYKNPFSTHLTNLGYFHSRGKNAYRIYKAPNIDNTLPLTFYNPYQPIAKKATDHFYVCEGEWDTLAMLDIVKDKENIIVLGVPGALIFPEANGKWFSHAKHVDLFFDNDEAGNMGKEKASLILHRWQKSVQAVDWSTIDYADANYDIRDVLTKHPDTAYNDLSSALIPVTPGEGEEEDLSAGYVTSINDIVPIDTFDNYIDQYSEHLHLSDENIKAIAITMAIATSQYIPGEPLWFFAVGQAGCGKTTLIESYGGNNEYFDYASRITAKSLVSGWNSGGETSLLPRMNGKTFFIKDFTVVLGMPNEQRKEVFNLFRDIYDGTLNITFGNGKVCNFHNLRFNLIAGVTDAIKDHNDASMGERFLRFDYMGAECDDLAIIDSALSGFGQTNSRKAALTEATLGYVKTLVDNRWDLEDLPRLSAHSRSVISSLARYTAHIRTRPANDRQDGLKYRPRKEVASRLALQFAKLAYALEKVFYPKKKHGNDLDLSDRTLDHIAKVAHDTSEGFNQDVIRLLCQTPHLGRKDLESKLHLPSTRIHRVMTDLRTTKLVKVVTKLNDRSRNRDPKGRPSAYYSVEPSFLPIVEQVFSRDKK